MKWGLTSSNMFKPSQKALSRQVFIAIPGNLIREIDLKSFITSVLIETLFTFV